MRRYEIEKDVFVSEQPSEAHLQELPNEGFRSVLNLRSERGTKQAFPRVEERKMVEDNGMQYLHIPDASRSMHDSVDRFREVLAVAPKPVLVHAREVEDAAANALMDRAMREEWDSDQVFEKAREMGIELRGSKLERDLVITLRKP